MRQIRRKKPNIEKKTPKSQTIFLTPSVSKKSQICEIWSKKSQSGNPVLKWPLLFHINNSLLGGRDETGFINYLERYPRCDWLKTSY